MLLPEIWAEKNNKQTKEKRKASKTSRTFSLSLSTSLPLSHLFSSECCGCRPALRSAEWPPHSRKLKQTVCCRDTAPGRRQSTSSADSCTKQQILYEPFHKPVASAHTSWHSSSMNKTSHSFHPISRVTTIEKLQVKKVWKSMRTFVFLWSAFVLVHIRSLYAATCSRDGVNRVV